MFLFQNWYLAKAGEALTKRLRKESFLAFLRQVSVYIYIFEIPATYNIYLHPYLMILTVYIFFISLPRTLVIMMNLIMEQEHFVRGLHPRFPPFKGYVYSFENGHLNWSIGNLKVPFIIFFLQATGSQLGLFVAAVVTTVGGLIVAFSASWQITLVMIAFLPLLIIAGMSLNAFLGGGVQKVGVSAGQVSYCKGLLL